MWFVPDCGVEYVGSGRVTWVQLRRVAGTEAAAVAKTAEETQSATAPAAKKRKRKAEAAEGSGGKSGAKQAKQTKERATAMRDIAGSDAEEEEEEEDVKARVQSKGQRGPWYNHADTSVERKMGKFRLVAHPSRAQTLPMPA